MKFTLSGGNMSEKGIIDALGRCSRCGQHVQSTAGCDCHTSPNDAKIDDNTFKQCFDRWVPNIDKEDEVDNDDIYAWCRNVLSMYLGIACKQSSEGSE